GLVLCLTLVALYSRAGRLAAAGLADYITGAILVAVNASVGPFILLIGDIHWGEVTTGRTLGRGWAVLRGLAVAVPLVFLFGALFASADAAFERLARAIIRVDFAELVVHAL